MRQHLSFPEHSTRGNAASYADCRATHDEANARIKLARMPLDLGDDTPRLPPALRLIAEAEVIAAHLVRRAPDRALEQVSDPVLQDPVGWQADRVSDALGFAGKAVRFSASGAATGCFDHLLQTWLAILPLPKTGEGAILAHNRRESGECRLKMRRRSNSRSMRFLRVTAQWCTSMSRRLLARSGNAAVYLT
jgi:hypothetical protein